MSDIPASSPAFEINTETLKKLTQQGFEIDSIAVIENACLSGVTGMLVVMPKKDLLEVEKLMIAAQNPQMPSEQQAAMARLLELRPPRSAMIEVPAESDPEKYLSNVSDFLSKVEMPEQPAIKFDSMETIDTAVSKVQQTTRTRLRERIENLSGRILTVN